MNKLCRWDGGWAGRCQNVGSNSDGMCDEHTGLTCVSCGKPAVRSCPSASSLVCGAPLCESCKHSAIDNRHVTADEYSRQLLLNKKMSAKIRKDGEPCD